MKVTSDFGIFKNMLSQWSFFYCYLEREHSKVLKFHVTNASSFEMSVSLFLAPRFNKPRALMFEIKQAHEAFIRGNPVNGLMFLVRKAYC